MQTGRERLETSSQGERGSGRAEPVAGRDWGAGRRSGASGRTDLLSSVAETTTSTELYSPVPDGYQRGRHRFIVVLGTVMSGLGKGIFASSVAKMLTCGRLGNHRIDAKTLGRVHQAAKEVLAPCCQTAHDQHRAT